MNKEIITISKEYEYLNQIPNFELPFGIFNKKLTGVGGTTLALTNDKKYIILSPRKELIKNKHYQYPDTTLIVDGDTTNSSIFNYVADGGKKIISTFDSFYRLEELNINEWNILVDEFQCLLLDSAFKSEICNNLINKLSQYEKVTYMSATPILNEYIQKIEAFKNLKYTELEFENVEKVNVLNCETNSPLRKMIDIIKTTYKSNDYLEYNGLKSEEIVIYLNSVNDIISIIKSCKLEPYETNIVCSNKVENNEKLIKKLGSDWRVGTLSDGKKYKYTFCTSTAYFGCDMYSDNATTFVVSNAMKNNTLTDISTELVQIAGRQRNKNNPFKNTIFFIYNTKINDIDIQQVNNKLQTSKTILNDLKNLEYNTIYRKMIELYSNNTYNEDYVYFDEKTGKFYVNEMLANFEKFQIENLKKIYTDGISIKKQIDENDMLNYVYTTYSKIDCSSVLYSKMKNMNSKKELLKYAVELNGMGKEKDLTILKKHYPEINYYFTATTANRIKANGYNTTKIDAEIAEENNKKNKQIEIDLLIENSLYDEIPVADANEILVKISDNLKLKNRIKIKNLSNFCVKQKKINGKNTKVLIKKMF